MSRREMDWIFSALFLNTFELAYSLYKMFVLNIESFSSMFIPIIPVFIFNIVTFVYFVRKKKELVS
jgi:hypothetical protein